MRVLVNVTPKNQKRGELKEKLEYIMDSKKTQGKYIYAYRCDKSDPYKDMMLVKKMHKKYGGVQYLHYVQSFMAYDTVTPEQVMRLGIQMSKFFKDFQSVTCVHLDTDKIHYHTIVNTVHMETGKKLRFGPKQLYQFWHYGVDVYNEQNLPWEITDSRIHEWLEYTTIHTDELATEPIELDVHLIKGPSPDNSLICVGGKFNNGVSFFNNFGYDENDCCEESITFKPTIHIADNGEMFYSPGKVLPIKK